MEYVDGENLGQVVREKGRLKEYEALCIMYEVTRGLAFAHSMGIIHRDVKPENIMLTSRRTVKIGDLGLAKWKPKGVDLALTADGASMGTPYYVSPEQIRGLKDIDARADIYSLGMTFDHLLRGRPAFCDGTATKIMTRHLSDEIPSLRPFNPDITLSTLELLTALTVKDRESRIQEMSGVTDMIGQMLRYQQTERTGPGRSSVRRTRATAKPRNFWSRFWKAGWRVFIDTTAVMVGLAVAVGVLMVWRQYQSTEKQEASQVAVQSEGSAPSVQNTAPIPTTGSSATAPAMPSEQSEESAFAGGSLIKLQGSESMQAFTITGKTEGPDGRQKNLIIETETVDAGMIFQKLQQNGHLSKLNVSAGSDRHDKWKFLVRVHFQKIKGMETPDGFIATIRQCKRATLELTPMAKGGRRRLWG